MKFKVTWFPEDIRGGLKVKSMDNPTETWMIGYDHIKSECALISLEDGMIAYSGDKEFMARKLTNSNWGPVAIVNAILKFNEVEEDKS